MGAVSLFSIFVLSLKFCFSQETSCHPAAPRWIEDRLVRKCMRCRDKFSVLVRKHHCRACGGIFCANCSDHSVPLPQYGYKIDRCVRVCTNCIERDSQNAFDMERKLWKCWKEILHCHRNELHHFPLNSVVEHLQSAKDKQIPIAQPIWKYSVSLLSQLIEIRYVHYNKEARSLLDASTIIDNQKNDAVTEKKSYVLSHVYALNVFVSELHHDILSELKVSLPKDLKPNILKLRKQVAGNNGSLLDEDHQVPSSVAKPPASLDEDGLLTIQTPSLQ
jgi:hypothetical protein